jgi:hypothetical protein
LDKLTIADLHKLEDYAERRDALRKDVIARKKVRSVHLGAHLTLLFEDRLLVQYQIQEMLRIERIFEKAAIQDELDAYNPLIPDGTNWKATCLIEYEDVEERRQALERLKGVEHALWVEVGESGRTFAIADEDLDRSNDSKTSAVHFLRFELSSRQRAELKDGAAVTVGVDHEAYRHELVLPAETRASLVADLS